MLTFLALHLSWLTTSLNTKLSYSEITIGIICACLPVVWRSCAHSWAIFSRLPASALSLCACSSVSDAKILTATTNTATTTTTTMTTMAMTTATATVTADTNTTHTISQTRGGDCHGGGLSPAGKTQDGGGGEVDDCHNDSHRPE